VISFKKRRDAPPVGSIAGVLDVFRSEVRFYREIAPVVGLRVPECFDAEMTGVGTRLVLEDLSSWSMGGDPAAVAGVLATLHSRWENRAAMRWPWLRTGSPAADLISDLFDRIWPTLSGRGDVSRAARELGDRMFGHVAEAERAAADVLPFTLCHGDASLRNAFTAADGEVALVDWEDVRNAAGVTDLAWLLVSSVEPIRWVEVIDAYGPAPELTVALPAAVAQGLLSLSDCRSDDGATLGWVQRLDAAAQRRRQ
jgi:hypothetical protein